MAKAVPERKDRRGAIARGLYRCISERGYANTTLKQIADAAGMSPSHVGYYFDNKAAILEYYGAAICDGNLATLPELAGRELAGRDLEQQVEVLAEFFLGEGQMNTALLGVIQELSGLAVHDATLHDIKANHQKALREYFESFFERSRPADGLSPREAAWLAHATLDGLNSNTLFDSDLDREHALGLFRRTLRVLTGLDEVRAEGAATARKRRSPRSPRSTPRRTQR